MSHRMFNFNVNLKQLPSRQTVLRISDEAQYLTKAFYGEKMEDSDHFGIKKDGTQRQKVKMLDNSITLPSGDVLPLGFRRVAKEDATSITNNTKLQINC